MKCLKSSKTGNIIRVSDREAYNATSEWKFIPKSEWKADRRPAKKEVEVIVEVQEQTIAEKQLSKKKKDK
jgi:hypothetical protein|tara:strand:- start:251 stop:460 length:210 start_codon:yes stop_codon:yes gene_type:complete